MKNVLLKTYAKYKVAMMNRKGSQTLEYIFLIAGVIAVAALLKTVLGGEEVSGELKSKVKEWISNADK
ncbi:hypothetical protein GCM10011571_24560 [Marinithermofilum abyssi]|jgi:hypothetical protein|uniref:Class III signal peptide n=1 Tax=Marinithermofilum abyssi TaxID=1571185 RepID=A0A8J2VC56_9BACL|nr:hypothetical protein [Marinithermofilum abyssi]GGE21557.1 hypothetical protein GCM10011571_24560 [Marinithermofilum abyssi]